MTILYLITIVLSYILFREIVKINSHIFDEIEIRDLVNVLMALVIPVFNIVFTLFLYISLSRKTGEDFSDILKKMLFLK